MREIQEHIMRLRVWAVVSRDGEIISAHSTYYQAEEAWGGDTTLRIIYLPEHLCPWQMKEWEKKNDHL